MFHTRMSVIFGGYFVLAGAPRRKMRGEPIVYELMCGLTGRPFMTKRHAVQIPISFVK